MKITDNERGGSENLLNLSACSLTTTRGDLNSGKTINQFSQVIFYVTMILKR
jgi:hypothetical protein